MPKVFTIHAEKLWILLFTLIILPFFWICTTLLGSNWQKMTPISYLIAFSKAKSPAQWTINVAIDNNKHYMHIYFDTLIFYLALIITLLVSFIIRLKFTTVQYKLKDIIFYRKTKKGIAFISYGQFITLFTWFITILLIFIQFMWYHQYWEYLIGDDPVKLAPKTSNYFARSMGIISTILFGLAIIPVTRANPILKLCFGLSYENIIQYHRVLGLLCFFCMFLHIVIFVILLDHNNLLQHLYPFANDSPWLLYHPGNFTINMMYIVVIFVIIPFFISSAPGRFRWKLSWELFYYIHIYGTMVMVIAILFHSNQAWYFMLPGIALQFYEYLKRMCNTTNNIVEINSVQIIEESNLCKIEINMCNPYPDWPLGAYCFINIPNISPFQWHPFSISNALNEDIIVLYIKGLGNWSQRLVNLCKYNDKIMIGLEGPYGCDLDYKSYDKIVFVAGGIGITPMYNIFVSLYQMIKDKSINRIELELIWIVKNAVLFQIFWDKLQEIHNENGFTIKLFVTQDNRQDDAVDDNKLYWNFGRPDVNNELSKSVGTFGNKGLVYISGPKSLIMSCFAVALKNGNHVKKETYLF